MSIKNVNDLKNEFVSGTAATPDKFADLIDSAYNKANDSVLLGPIGQTGQNGLLGPTGSVFYNGLWYEYIGGSSGPIGATDSGKPGQIFANENGLWICISEDNWIFLSVLGGVGATGPKGETGPQGVTGPQGIQGTTGVGIQGVTGPQGIQGTAGIGIQGVTGPQGIQGVTGPQGIQGVTGPQGIQGVTGPQGIQGTAGIGIQGETGPQGVTGATGGFWTDGTIPSGPTSAGSTGQYALEVVIGASPELGYLYLYDVISSRWVKFTGAAWDW
jgi:hypothetical protein